MNIDEYSTHTSMNNLLVGIIIIVVILVITIVTMMNVSTYEKYLYGAWIAADDEFCETAEIDSMLLFIGEPTLNWRSRVRIAYLVICPNECKQGLTITYRRGWGGPWLHNYKIVADVKFEDDQLWDERCELVIDMVKGTMIITGIKSKTIYAKLCKQHDITNIAATLEDAKMVNTDEAIKVLDSTEISSD